MRRARWIGFLLVLVFLSGCGATLSTRAKATMILSTYATQGEQTKKDADNCLARGVACTESERDVIRQKKAALLKLDPLVEVYGVVVNAGGVPSTGDEQAIYDLIDELVGLGL